MFSPAAMSQLKFWNSDSDRKLQKEEDQVDDQFVYHIEKRKKTTTTEDFWNIFPVKAYKDSQMVSYKDLVKPYKERILSLETQNKELRLKNALLELEEKEHHLPEYAESADKIIEENRKFILSTVEQMQQLANGRMKTMKLNEELEEKVAELKKKIEDMKKSIEAERKCMWSNEEVGKAMRVLIKDKGKMSDADRNELTDAVDKLLKHTEDLRDDKDNDEHYQNDIFADGNEDDVDEEDEEYDDEEYDDKEYTDEEYTDEEGEDDEDDDEHYNDGKETEYEESEEENRARRNTYCQNQHYHCHAHAHGSSDRHRYAPGPSGSSSRVQNHSYNPHHYTGPSSSGSGLTSIGSGMQRPSTGPVYPPHPSAFMTPYRPRTLNPPVSTVSTNDPYRSNYVNFNSYYDSYFPNSYGKM